MNKKGAMARRLVYYCIAVLTAAAIWALALKTYGVMNDVAVELSDVLVFIGAAFGGELLMLLIKRTIAKNTTEETEE